jgi:hypothetical protein
VKVSSRFSIERTPESQISESHPSASRNPHAAPAGGGDGCRWAGCSVLGSVRVMVVVVNLGFGFVILRVVVRRGL